MQHPCLFEAEDAALICCSNIFLTFFLFFLFVLQMPKPAPAGSSCVPTASAWPPSTYATVTTTVETAVMSSSVPPLWPADPTISAATPPSVCHSCGAAMETPIALTVQTRVRSAAAAMGSRTCLTAGPTALLRSSAVPTGSVCGWPGSVMEIPTARTSLMSLTAVSFSFCLVSPPWLSVLVLPCVAHFTRAYSCSLWCQDFLSTHV